MPLRLYLEMHDVEQLAPCYVGACGIKVFKDKGGDRKQRQDQAKLEKLPSTEQVCMCVCMYSLLGALH